LCFFPLLFLIHHSSVNPWFSQDLGRWHNAWYSKALGVLQNITLLPSKFLIWFILDGKFCHFILFVILFYLHVIDFECLSSISCICCSHRHTKFTFFILRHVYQSGQFITHVHAVICRVLHSKKLITPQPHLISTVYRIMKLIAHLHSVPS
jgi:hypothetical protein